MIKKTTLSILLNLFKLFGKKLYLFPLDYNPYKGTTTQSAKQYIPAYVSIIEESYGHAKSRALQESIDNQGNPLPWFTYPAIEYLKQLDLKNKTVFEWGSGNSSLFFSALAEKVYSIEHNKEWYIKVKNLSIQNQTIIHAIDDRYINLIEQFDRKFDVIVIDGILRDNCARIAPSYINETGMIILDNSDRYPLIANALRKKNLLQVDMHGLGPINDYTWTTSFFFSRMFNFQPINVQPVIPIGGGY